MKVAVTENAIMALTVSGFPVLRTVIVNLTKIAVMVYAPIQTVIVIMILLPSLLAQYLVLRSSSACSPCVFSALADDVKQQFVPEE